MIECYRCGAEIAADRVDLEGWVVLHAWRDGHALFVCGACQTSSERAVVEAVEVDAR